MLDEPGSRSTRLVWTRVDGRASSVVLLAEARAALSAARRARRATRAQHARAVHDLARLWREVDGLDVTEALASRAGELAEAHGLRGYDAVHLACAEAVLDEGDVMVVADHRLAAAASAVGLEALVPAR